MSTTATTFAPEKKTYNPRPLGRRRSRSMTDGYTLMRRNRVGMGLAAAALVVGTPALALAQAAAPAPPPTVSGADTAWMLIATALVLLMTPALAFFYGG